MGIFFCFAVAQLIHLALWKPGPNAVNNLPAANAVASNRPRVVWILFDELSYQQTFGDRYPSLHLPNFDKLRQSSTMFTNVQPVANYTELAIPSILLNSVVVRTKYTYGNRLLAVETGERSFRPFDVAKTPFAAAQKVGLKTGVIGWYNPYCGMLAPYLNVCYWTNQEGLPQQYGIYDGFWKDLGYGILIPRRRIPLQREQLASNSPSRYISGPVAPFGSGSRRTQHRPSIHPPAVAPSSRHLRSQNTKI